MLQSGIAVVERDATIESLVEMNFGAGEAEAAGLLGDLKALALPLHDVVVADHALMDEATDAVQIFRGGTPGGEEVAGRTGEATVVVGNKTGQDGIGRVQIGGASQAEFAGETVLEHPPEAFDAAFGLWGLGGDEGNAELFKGTAELGGLALAGELFSEGPGIVVADKDAAAIAVESQRHTVTLQELAEQREISESGFGREELGGQDFTGGIVLHAQSGEAGAAALEPVMGRAVQLHQFSELSGAQTTLAMSGSAAFSGRTETGRSQEATQGLAAEGEALALAQFLAQVMVVEAGIGGAGQTNDGLAHPPGQATGAGTTAVGVCQSRLSLLPQAFLQTPDLTDAKREQFGGSGTRHVSFKTTGNHTHSLQFLLTQRERPSSHGVTFSRCR